MHGRFCIQPLLPVLKMFAMRRCAEVAPRVRRGFMVLCWLPWLSGCLGGNEMFEPDIKADAGSAVMHLYRPAASTPGITKPLRFSWPEVFVDGESVGTVKYNEYISFRVSPGKHVLRVTGLTAQARDWDLRDVDRSFTAKAGETYYMRMKVDFNVTEMYVVQPRPSYIYQVMPATVDEAKYEIRKVSPAR